jgi:hypothetical protein
MAYPIRFRQELAERWLEAMHTGKPLTAPENRWTNIDMTMLAGVLHFACLSGGPSVWRRNPELWEALPTERKEATEETLDQDIHDAISFNSQMTWLLKDGKYEERFEPELAGAVFRDEGKPKFQVVRGKR